MNLELENRGVIAKEVPPGDIGWAERCQYWLNSPIERKKRGPPPRRRSHEPLVLTGHGMRLNIYNGALVVRGGFSHYPQPATQWRLFPSDPHFPSRIVMLDCCGSWSN